MSKRCFILFFLVLFLITEGCKSITYIYDAESRERQQDLKKHRSGNIFTDIGLSFVSVVTLVVADVNLGLYPADNNFKKLKLINPTKDTMYINMLTDVYWDEENFCDFLDVRIPPRTNMKMLIPVNAWYNIYYSDTPESDDDELIEINTSEIKKLSLYPGMTKPEEISKESDKK